MNSASPFQGKKFQKDTPKPDDVKAVNELYLKVQRRLIAALLYDNSHVIRVLELVALEDIEEPALGLIFNSMIELARRNEPVTIMAVAKELEAAGNFALAGGPEGLYQLREEGRGYLKEATAELYAMMVKEASSKHKLRNLLADYRTKFANDSGQMASDTVADLQNSLNTELYKLSNGSEAATLTEDYDAYLKLLDDRVRTASENDGTAEGLQGIPSLLPTINHYTTGWLPGQLITVGARTGIGKSVFAVNCAVAAAQAKKTVLFFSLEMGKEDLTDRIVSSSTGVLLNKLRMGNLTEIDRQILADSDAMIRAMNIRIDPEARVTVDSIRAKALKQAQSPEGLDFIIVDYLQLITPSGKYSSRQEAVADVSRNMKLLAKQLNVPIMVLVQVNREGKEDENPVPKLSQIRESGAIAQDSDIVILLHRQETLDDSTPYTLVLLEKNRNGEAQKTVHCHSNLECSLFREVVRAKDVDRLTEADQDAALDDLDMAAFGTLTDDMSEFDFAEDF